jgi:hypothetical protein
MLTSNQQSDLRAALERAAATLKNAGQGTGLIAPMPFGGPGMFNPMPMAQQGQHPTANQYVAQNFMPPTANQYVAQNFPSAAAPAVPTANAAPVAQGQAQAVPMPQARPAEAPSPMGFFARNAAMMIDPVTGGFIDPRAAAQADNGGIIKKMLGHLYNKANNA